MSLPFLLFSDEKGKIFSHPNLRMAGFLPDKPYLPAKKELITAPKGTSFFYLPASSPWGFDSDSGKFKKIKMIKGKRVYAVAAFMPPAYLRLYNPAASFEKKRKKLPLWAYTACGFYGGKFKVAAYKIDKRIRQSPRFYDQKAVKIQAQKYVFNYPKNRLYRHLFNCALNYNCLAAKNLFLQRWEAPLPVARFCNARCIGCLSHQEQSCFSSHQRVKFKPKVSEVVEVMANHLMAAKEAIVSFGQGCEGEPLLEADLIAESVRIVRKKTAKGTININTNASYPEKIRMLCDAGVDSFRISLNSPDEKFYNAYFKPVDYKFLCLSDSIKIAKKKGKFVSLNLFIFPGFSDSRNQIQKLIRFLKANPVDMIQWRNLNIDPDYYLEKIKSQNKHPQGVLELVNKVQSSFPAIKTGYFNLPKEKF